MNRLIILGAAVIGGVIALELSSEARRRGIAAALRRRMLRGMETMIASLPEDAPPRLVVTVLPRLRDQNDRIIALLQEQNELLRKQTAATP